MPMHRGIRPHSGEPFIFTDRLYFFVTGLKIYLEFVFATAFEMILQLNC
jgi:hypothetical protein